jgi:hypothetical protein
MRFAKMQSRLSLGQQQDYGKLADSAYKFIREQDALTKITGLNAKQQLDTLDEAMSNQRYAAVIDELTRQEKHEEVKQLQDRLIIAKKLGQEKGFQDIVSGFIGTQASQQYNMLTQGQGLRETEDIKAGRFVNVDSSGKRTRDEEGFAASTEANNLNPLAPRLSHFPSKAKSVIFMFMVGGPSQIDLFDPKPELNRLNGQPLPPSFGKPVSQFTKGDTPILGSTRKFQKHGKSGLEVSDLMPNLAQCVDDICFLRSCWCTSTVHAPAMYEMHSGRTLMGHPSLGSWVSYGLGSTNENLPAYCVLLQPEGTPEGGAPCWSNAYLPAVYQGTLLRRGANPLLHLKPPADITPSRQRATIDFIKQMNEKDLDPSRTDLAARIASYELAFRMQSHAPEAVDLSKESERTKNNYGLNDKKTSDFGTRCLLARRLVERGVRFVQLYSGGGPLVTQWDAHDDINSNHEKKGDGICFPSS